MAPAYFGERFSRDLMHAGTARDRYLAALRAADAGDIGPLLEFVRS